MQQSWINHDEDTKVTVWTKDFRGAYTKRSVTLESYDKQIALLKTVLGDLERARESIATKGLPFERSFWLGKDEQDETEDH